MRPLQLFQVDAFTHSVFGGNPAAVCPLDAWLPDSVLQHIAEENNVAETAFFVPAGGAGYELRWFTPRCEVPLCGHATLAAAFVLFTEMTSGGHTLTFHTQSGELRVARDGTRLTMDFPSIAVRRCDAAPATLTEGLGVEPLEVHRSESDPNYLVVVGSEHEVASLRPRISIWEALHPHGVIVTARGESADFVSRYFAPSYGIPEDPVTGSAHCALAPYWANRLGRTQLHARQLSRRGGELTCRVDGERVLLSGEAALYTRERCCTAERSGRRRYRPSRGRSSASTPWIA